MLLVNPSKESGFLVFWLASLPESVTFWKKYLQKPWR
jgi:hypothetical protein